MLIEKLGEKRMKFIQIRIYNRGNYDGGTSKNPGTINLIKAQNEAAAIVKWGAHVTVSMHFNNATPAKGQTVSTAQGYEFILKKLTNNDLANKTSAEKQNIREAEEKSMKLAKAIEQKFVLKGMTTTRENIFAGTNANRFLVSMKHNPAVIVEPGFACNEHDRTWLMAHVAEICDATAAGIVTYMEQESIIPRLQID